MPANVPVDTPGALRFFLQPRWAPGPHSVDRSFRRRDLPAYTELELELPFEHGSVVGVLYVMPHGDGSASTVAACFETFFQPVRRLLYGPGDDRRRRRLWERMPYVRPLFMAVNENGLHLNLDDVALLQHDDPGDGTKKNIVVSVERDRAFGAALDERVVERALAVLGVSLQLWEEAQSPLDLDALYQGAELAAYLEVAGAAAKWLLNNAGDIGDVLSLLDVLTD